MLLPFLSCFFTVLRIFVFFTLSQCIFCVKITTTTVSNAPGCPTAAAMDLFLTPLLLLFPFLGFVHLWPSDFSTTLVHLCLLRVSQLHEGLTGRRCRGRARGELVDRISGEVVPGGGGGRGWDGTEQHQSIGNTATSVCPQWAKRRMLWRRGERKKAARPCRVCRLLVVDDRRPAIFSGLN